MKIKVFFSFLLLSVSVSFAQEEPKLAAYSIAPVPGVQSEPAVEPVLAPYAVSENPVFVERRKKESQESVPVLAPFQLDPKKKD